MCEELEAQVQQLKKESLDIIQKLRTENEQLRQKLKKIEDMQRSFLNESQIQKLEKKWVKEWSKEAIIHGLKLRFALGVDGYIYLLSTKYPAPTYSTLARRIQDFKLDFGIFHNVIQILKVKAEFMEPCDRFCLISYDEMQISKKVEFDRSTGKAIGYVTLDPKVEHENWAPTNDDLGEKLFLVVVKGIKNHWKQVIACHVTRKGMNTKEEREKMRELFKQFILQCITAVESCGFHVVTLSSDLDNRNKSMWTSLGIKVASDGSRSNSFIHNNHEIYAQPDPCHI